MSINQFNVEMNVKPYMVEILNVVATQDLVEYSVKHLFLK